MTMLRSPRILALAFFCGSWVSAAPPPRESPSATRVIAFLHANVVPMDEERVLLDRTVVVVDGRIAEIGPSSAVKIPADALRVEAAGRYLIPALCDMHVHLLGEAWNALLPPEDRLASQDVPYESFLLPYVANGVTLVQELSAVPEEVALRRRIDRGELLGPRLVLARMVDGPGKAWPPPLSTWVASPAEARDAVRQAKADGYDKIKVYSFLDRDSYDAIVATAREVGMDVIGHVPVALSVDYVLDAGQKFIAHSEEVLKHAGPDKYAAARIEGLAGQMAQRGVWMAPTLVTTRGILEVFDDPGRHRSRPEDRYYRHPMEQGVWSFIVEKLYRPIPAEARASIRNGLDRFQRPLTKAFHDKGGKLMAGSDTVIPYLVPGFALHAELREMVDLGLTPFQALRTSTTVPFEYLGESGRAGTIEVGKRSDLVLLGGDPLVDISAASRIEGVWMRGRWLGKEEIDRRMQALAASFEARVAPQAQDH